MNTKIAQKLRDPHPHIGTWLSLGSSVVAELAADCGLEWVLLDLEHGFGSEDALLTQLQALRGGSTAAIVRLGGLEPDLILHALDRGAGGIMVPHVSSAAEAEACVQAAHYPPRGHRGYSRSTRSHGYGLSADPGPPPVVMTQIETIAGVENAPAIAAVDGVDVLFVGPSDLKFDLRTRTEPSPYNFEECLTRVAAAAAGHGKTCGILVRDHADLPTLRDLGFTVLAVDSDLGILRAHYQTLVKLVAP
jgi:2-keto-3-deoxy-L-rhamnonate aldolase RhmA